MVFRLMQTVNFLFVSPDASQPLHGLALARHGAQGRASAGVFLFRFGIDRGLIEGDFKLQDILTEVYPFGSHVIENYVFVEENSVRDDKVLLEEQMIFLGQLPGDLCFTAIAWLLLLS